MSIKRAINIGDYSSGTVFGTDVAETLNYFSQRDLKILTNVVGTNSLVATFLNTSGFSSISSGTEAVLIPVNDNTGAVTIKLQNQSGIPIDLTTDIPLVKRDGSSLSSGDLQAGTLYQIVYSSALSSWVLNTVVPSDIPSPPPSLGSVRKSYKKGLNQSIATLNAGSFVTVSSQSYQNVLSDSVTRISFLGTVRVTAGTTFRHRVTLDGSTVMTSAASASMSPMNFVYHAEEDFTIGNVSSHTIAFQIEATSNAAEIIFFGSRLQELAP